MNNFEQFLKEYYDFDDNLKVKVKNTDEKYKNVREEISKYLNKYNKKPYNLNNNDIACILGYVKYDLEQLENKEPEIKSYWK